MSYKTDTNQATFIVKLDTHKAQSISADKATFGLINPISVPQNVDLLMRLNYFTIANVFPNIPSYENRLDYQVGSSTYTLYITPENYDVNSLRSYLNANLQGGISVSYISTTNKYLFSCSQSFALLETSTCLEQLGFFTKRYNSSNNEIESDSFVNLAGLAEIFIHTNLNTSNRDSFGATGNLLDFVPVSNNYGTLVIYDNPIGHFSLITQKYINSIDVSLFDAEDNQLDISEVHFLMVLEFSTRLTRTIPTIATLISEYATAQNQDFTNAQSSVMPTPN